MVGIDDEWREAVGRARAAHPALRAVDDFEPFAIAARDRGARVEHLGDLLLAWAAARGDGAAVRAVEQLIVDEATTAARRIDRATAFVDEICQQVRVRLLVVDGGRARIADYAGRGPIRGWIGVAATRTALNHKRAAGPPAPDLLVELVSHEADPELRHLKTLYRAEFRDALEAAVRALPERQRAVLRLTFVDGLKLARLASLYGVHEATVSRWVKAAQQAVADDARARLMARLALSPSSLDSVARMVLSNLELSIARVLGG